MPILQWHVFEFPPHSLLQVLCVYITSVWNLRLRFYKKILALYFSIPTYNKDMKDNQVTISDINFTMLKYCGVWRPSSMDSKFGKFIYHSYTIFVTLIVLSLVVQKFVVIPSSTKDLDELIDHQFPFLEILCVTVKGYNLLSMHRKIKLAVQSLMSIGLYNNPINQQEVDWKLAAERKSRFVQL